MSGERLRRALREEPVPEAREAEDRAWRVVRTAPPSTPPATRLSPGLRRTVELALAASLLAAMISPAGAAVRDWVGDTIRSEQSPSRPALTSLPGAGSLLVDSPRGPWVVRDDGSKRLLGSYAEATWSPRGLFVAVTTPHQLIAVDPMGEVRWSLARRGRVSGAAWSPDGYRIAYLAGERLRVVAGDGTGDRLVAAGAARLAPAWAAGDGHRLSYVDLRGNVRTLDVDRGRTLHQFAAPPAVSELSWSRDGDRLLVVAAAELQLRSRRGALLWHRQAPRSMRFDSAAVAPEGGVVATLATASGSSSELLSFDRRGGPRRLFSGLGRMEEVAFSPDGSWLLVAWRSADQWLFLNRRDPRRIVAVSDIAAQFDPGAAARSEFPRVAGWCCPPVR